MAPPPTLLASISRPFASLRGFFTLFTVVLIAAGTFFLVNTASSWPASLSNLEPDASGSDRFNAHIQTGLWRATLLTVSVLLGGVVTAKWWLRPQPVIPPRWLERASSPSLVSQKFLVFALLAAVILGASLRLPRMDVGVYFDEMHSLRHYSVGRHDQKGNHVLKFRKAKWKDTLWLDRESNNHVMYSIVSRLSLDLWKTLGLRQEGRYSEVAARLPSLIAGLTTIFLVGWLLYRLGFPTAGILAAFILALHPWHLRYSAEARGYAMCLFFSTLMILFLVRALRSGRWRDWMGYAFCQFATLYCYAGSAYIPLAVNAAALTGLGFLAFRKSSYPAKDQALRLVVASVASATAIIQLMAPCLIQLAEFMQRPHHDRPPRPGWLIDFWAYLTSGMPWTESDPTNPIHFAISTGGAALTLFVALICPLAAIAGAIRLSLGMRLGLIIALAFILPAPIGYLHSFVSGNHLHIWYLIFALPGTVILLGLGLTYFGSFLAGAFGKYRTSAAFILGTVYLALFAWLTQDQRKVYQQHAKEPLKEVIHTIYRDIDPYSPEADEVITAGVWSDAVIYDPWILHVFRPKDFFAVMERSLDENRPFYYTYGHSRTARHDVPDAFVLIDNPKLFRPINKFWGLEERQFNHYLLEFVGDRAAVEEAKNNPVASFPPQP